FGATALDEAMAALGDTPKVHEGIQFTTPDIAENGAVVPIRVEVDSVVPSSGGKMVFATHYPDIADGSV
ncbi:MAG: hypothetical protein ACPGF8_05690, partial [Opitutales bacterium]